MYKRVHAIYGDDFEELSGSPPLTATSTQEIKVKSVFKPEQRISRYKRYNTTLHFRHQKSIIWQSKCRDKD